MMYGYERQLKPDRWAGIGSACAGFGQDIEATNLPAAWGVVGCRSGFSTVPILDGDGGSVTGEDDRWPTYYLNSRFPTDAGNIFWGGTITRFNFSSARRALFQGGDWLTGAATCRAIINRGSVGATNIGYYSTRGGDSFRSDDNQALSLGYNLVDIPIAAGAGDIVCEFYGSNAGNDERGQNLYFMSYLLKANDVSGLTLATLGVSGAAVADLDSTSVISDAAIAAYISAFSTDTIMINIGTNDFQPWTPAQHAHLLGVINRWRAPITAAGRTFKCLLISPYSQALSNYQTVAADMREIASAYTDVSFFDQNAVAGTYTNLNAHYLADGTHPNAAGANYLAALLQNALAAAACNANCDGSTTPPILTANDFQCFLDRFAANDTFANCDRSTAAPVLTVNDFQCFLNQFVAGCT